MLNEDLEVHQGDDYAVIVTVKNYDGTPADLTGYTAKAQVRKTPADSGPASEFSAIIQPPNLISLTLTHAQTILLAGTYYWDVQIKSAGGAVTTLIKGRVIVTQEVTREAVV